MSTTDPDKISSPMTIKAALLLPAALDVNVAPLAFIVLGALRRSRAQNPTWI